MIIHESKSTKKLEESGGSDENFVGKTATDLVSKLKAKGYSIDSSDLIYIKNNPKGINGDSIILIKGSKKYRATFNYYFNGDYEVLVYYDKLAESKYINEADRMNLVRGALDNIKDGYLKLTYKREYEYDVKKALDNLEKKKIVDGYLSAPGTKEIWLVEGVKVEKFLKELLRGSKNGVFDVYIDIYGRELKNYSANKLKKIR